MSGREPTFRLLIKEGAEIDKANKRGYTLLMWACGNGHEAITLALLDAGADPLAVNEYGKTAEQWAAKEAQRFPLNPEEDRQRIRRCVELLQQPRELIPWSPAKHKQFPKCSRKRAAALAMPLLRAGHLIALRCLPQPSLSPTNSTGFTYALNGLVNERFPTEAAEGAAAAAAAESASGAFLDAWACS